jgi:PAS domain S-box-containing protein
METSQLEGLARALFEESGDALFLFDPDTDQLLDVNPLAEKLTGFGRRDLLRMPATYYFRFGGKGGRERMHAAASRTSVFHSQEDYFLRTSRDGVWIAVNLTVSRLHLRPKTLALITARDVRERYEAGVKLERMEAELRRVLASVSDCLWSAEIDGQGKWTYRYFSPVVEKITGRTAAFFKAGLPQWWKVVHADDVSRAQAAYARLRGGAPIHEEYRLVWPDGTVRWVRDSVQVSRDSRGDGREGSLRLDGVLTDITERKQTEEALEHERYLLCTLMDNLPDSIYFKDARSRFLRVNKAQAAWLGLAAPAQAVGKSDFDFFADDHARPAYEDEQEVMRTGQPLLGKEEKETWPDGRETWVLTTKLPLRDPQGHIAGTFGISRDITRRKQTEQELARLLLREQVARREMETVLASLRESESRFRRLYESSIIGIHFADLYGRIHSANDAFLRMIGYDRADLPLRWDDQLTPPEYRTQDQRAVEQLRASGVAPPWEKEYLRKDGIRVPVLIGVAMLEGSPDQCICFVLDMTERNRMRTLMTQADKLASIGLLSAGIAHEINNPLAYVGNNLAVLDQLVRGLMTLLDVYDGARDKLAEADPETARRAGAVAEQIDLPHVRDAVGRVLTRTSEGVKRITRIVTSLRGVARTDPGQLEEVLASDLIDMSLEMVRGRLKQSGIALDVSCPAGLKLHCSATQISQVLLNLLVNAVQAIESARPDGGGRLRISGRPVGSELVIEVADNGGGIDPHDLPRIFDPFFTRKKVNEGTGLGLSISRGIVEGHGGHIDVDSQPGEGSTFRVVLPLAPRPGAA